MGLIVSRFRRKPSTEQTLEKLDKSIKSLEQHHFSTQQRQKHIVGALLLYSIVLYIAIAAVLYFLYFPEERKQQVIYVIPLLIFPALVYLAKKTLHWYFTRKIARNDIKIIELRKKKKTILEKVMETETYKVAKDLLDKFDEKHNKSDSTEKLKKLPENMDLRKRSVSAQNTRPNQPTPMINGSRVLSATPTPFPYPNPTSITSPRLIRPILPKDRGVADRLVEYLIGDGPNSRYALICRRCSSHNGMALQEEFEYIAFRCCYCQYANPARKQRPNAPKLPESPQLSPQPVRKQLPEFANCEEAQSKAETEEEVISDPEEQKPNSPEEKNEVKDVTNSHTVEADEQQSISEAKDDIGKSQNSVSEN